MPKATVSDQETLETTIRHRPLACRSGKRCRTVPVYLVATPATGPWLSAQRAIPHQVVRNPPT
jgi:hypothetical protein